MRCPNCNKFVPYGLDQEPEVDLEIHQPSEDGVKTDMKTVAEVSVEITGTVRIALTCEECGGELKESTFELSDVEIMVPLTPPDGSDWEPDSEWELLTDSANGIDQSSEGKGRGAKTFYGTSMELEVVRNTTARDGNGEPVQVKATLTWEDRVQASCMDELT